MASMAQKSLRRLPGHALTSVEIWCFQLVHPTKDGLPPEVSIQVTSSGEEKPEDHMESLTPPLTDPNRIVTIISDQRL